VARRLTHIAATRTGQLNAELGRRAQFRGKVHYFMTNHKKKHRPKTKKIRNKNKSSDRKHVDHYVRFQAISTPEGTVEFEFGEDGRVISPQLVEGSVVSYSSFQRESGKEKYITQSPGMGKRGHMGQIHNIRSNYKFIAGIDTNNYDHQRGRISVSSSYLSDSPISEKTLSVHLMPAFLIFDINKDINPEIIGWHLFFNHILPMLEITSERRLAFVVDSELGKHQAINSRQVPYYQNYYLPGNVDLVYASSDTGTDATNQLIRACDRASKRLFSQVEDCSILIPETLGGATSDFKGYILVNFKNAKLTLQI
jgi:hypothetical protein